MVNVFRSRGGTSTFGCLVMLAILVAAGYYGLHIGGAYWRYYELLDDMNQQARFAGQTTDQAIQTALAAQADSLLGERPEFRIDRSGRPGRVMIQTEYRETFDLPLFKKTIVFRPRAEAPL
ncbi:MAG TPA: hypothetical protein VHR43_07085 [Gemmatimonadales bacterium]|jgi:hypothetical protein|nr:hypothetical protein [Gemmatimonadales bacterium]